MNKRDLILVMVAVVVVLITAFLLIKIYAPSNVQAFLDYNPFNGGSEATAQKAIDFINQNLIQEGKTAQLVIASKESGVIKFKISVDGTEYDSLVTNDGKWLCPQIFNLKASPSPSAQ